MPVINSNTSADTVNPADTHEVFNQSLALENYNLYSSDLPLRQALKANGDIDEGLLSAYGERCGRADVINWGYEANDNKPQLDTHDRFGHRVDLVRFHPAYHQLMDMALSAGIHSGPWRKGATHAHVQRAAKLYAIANRCRSRLPFNHDLRFGADAKINAEPCRYVAA